MDVKSKYSDMCAAIPVLRPGDCIRYDESTGKVHKESERGDVTEMYEVSDPTIVENVMLSAVAEKKINFRSGSDMIMNINELLSEEGIREAKKIVDSTTIDADLKLKDLEFNGNVNTPNDLIREVESILPDFKDDSDEEYITQRAQAITSIREATRAMQGKLNRMYTEYGYEKQIRRLEYIRNKIQKVSSMFSHYFGKTVDFFANWRDQKTLWAFLKKYQPATHLNAPYVYVFKSKLKELKQLGRKGVRAINKWLSKKYNAIVGNSIHYKATHTLYKNYGKTYNANSRTYIDNIESKLRTASRTVRKYSVKARKVAGKIATSGTAWNIAQAGMEQVVQYQYEQLALQRSQYELEKIDLQDLSKQMVKSYEDMEDVSTKLNAFNKKFNKQFKKFLKELLYNWKKYMHIAFDKQEAKILLKKITSDITSNKGVSGNSKIPNLTLPGHNYIGPGNPLDSGLAVNRNDSIAWAHDWRYHLSSTKEDITQADSIAINEFGTLWERRGDYVSRFAQLSLQAKFWVEHVFGKIIYPVL
jgi:hypothetical protein